MTGPDNMNLTPSTPTNDECAAFQAQLPDLIGSGETLRNHPHMLTCDRCPAFVRDLEYIAEAARQLMPAEAEPGDDLWKKIQRAIERDESGLETQP
jgi:hypothetical protein